MNRIDPGRVTLISFRDCPNADRARELLNQFGVSFVDVLQEDLMPGHPFLGYSSPTALRDEEILFGSRLDSGGSACSFNLPTAEDLLNLFRQA